jgi:parallel beta-helix repeat protein
MHLDVGSGYVVIGNKSYSNGGIGIVLTGASQSWIVHNTSEENRNWAGIALLDGSHENVLLNNTALRNSIGFVLDGATDNELRSNTASSNDTQGFVLIRGANENVLESNTSNQNLIGVEITEGSNSNQIGGNMANRNTSDGFKIYQSNGNRLSENTGDGNGDIGFLILVVRARPRLLSTSGASVAHLMLWMMTRVPEMCGRTTGLARRPVSTLNRLGPFRRVCHLLILE